MELKELKEVCHVAVSPTAAASFATSWSEDGRISVVTEAGLLVLNGRARPRQRGGAPDRTAVKRLATALAVLLALASPASASNITDAVFGSRTDGAPAAFADFNSDNYIDLFVVRDSGRTLEVMLASDQEPLLRPSPALRCSFPAEISSVVPGHFDADAHMDVLVTSSRSSGETQVYVLWGGDGRVNCSEMPLLTMHGQPTAVDYNHDMIMDLFGVDANEKRTFWIFNETRGNYSTVEMSRSESGEHARMKVPHSNAFLDLDGDAMPDLMLTTTAGFELWLGGREGGFSLGSKVGYPKAAHVGQSVFVDVELRGSLSHVVPVCYSQDCSNSSILVREQAGWRDLRPLLQDRAGKAWGFVAPDGRRYTDTITLRAGDFNMDGYPDLLATIRQAPGGRPRACLLENVACPRRGACGGLDRTFAVAWGALSPLDEGSVAGAFYDLYQDGVLDVILAGERTQAFRNTLDYDANFVKVMVLVGPRHGGNFPGARVSYRTTTQEGEPQAAVSAQLPQSAHFALGLPYTIFGLGRTPNFVDALGVGAGGLEREWTQIIPNSQVVVELWPLDDRSAWRARLFVTPSKLVLLSAAALLATCALVSAIVAALHYKERRQDRREKLQEAHRFHFDAM
ncbi:T-cell immunomodulatory protein [Bacillus rossius redtenbacheri]|uniref:T-cell immunomodulatory protein n=1 Tax=Bacillus rossius redtenbacheri TaxID=93214 RepID=UPI002FDDBA4A